MQANHRDADTSDSKPASDVHQSSGSDTLPDAYVREKRAASTRRNGKKIQRCGASSSEKKIRGRRSEVVTSEKATDAETSETRLRRSALEADAVDDTAAVCGAQTKPHGRLATRPLEELPNDAETWLKHVWPTTVAFEWKTPCVSAIARHVRPVGSALSATTQREAHRRTERHSGKALRARQRQKKRALAAHLSSSGKSVGELLQGSAFAMGDASQRKIWMEHLKYYSSTVQPPQLSQIRTKKPRIDTNSSQQRRQLSRLKTKMQGGTMDGCIADMDSGAVSLKVLMDAGILTAGEQIVVYSNAETEQLADLREDGCIHFEGHEFESAQAFAYHMQQTISPNANGEDGWKHVWISGRPLVDWVADYASELTGEPPPLSMPCPWRLHQGDCRGERDDCQRQENL